MLAYSAYPADAADLGGQNGSDDLAGQADPDPQVYAVAGPARLRAVAVGRSRDVVAGPNPCVEAGSNEAGRASLRHRCLRNVRPIVVIDEGQDGPARSDSVEAGCQYSTSRAPDRLQKLFTLHWSALWSVGKRFHPNQEVPPAMQADFNDVHGNLPRVLSHLCLQAPLREIFQHNVYFLNTTRCTRLFT